MDVGVDGRRDDHDTLSAAEQFTITNNRIGSSGMLSGRNVAQIIAG